ncbi:myosin phosphatase Rho-interacting protein-like isoform X2 [Paramacrobiotus metropolitanus]|uniref:myosin phosphatase Rho-interacting protein-like isoform X2 n=1 Tax=Paramacrobiotus metropolitanus TaxID=2943436 RepID=UPI0024456389|nr:myosin phosphatase Rho-interacting protein-like isoform X2 [Paramacrobiotus metropolitanus]
MFRSERKIVVCAYPDQSVQCQLSARATPASVAVSVPPRLPARPPPRRASIYSYLLLHRRLRRIMFPAARKICKCGYLFVAPVDYDCNNAAHRTRRWQQRWFVLYDDGELIFAVDNNSDTVPQAVIDMHRVTEVRDASELTGHECSLLLRAPDHDYFVKSSSKEEIRWWYDVLVMYPRSMRFTKQQRAHNQKRSRTLPNNALSDQQLKALRSEAEQQTAKAEPVQLVPPAKTAVLAPPPKPFRDPSRRSSQHVLPPTAGSEDIGSGTGQRPEMPGETAVDTRRKEVQREIRQSALDYLEALKERHLAFPGNAGGVNQTAKPEAVATVAVKKAEHFGADSFTDTDLSTDSEEVAHPAAPPVPASAPLPTPGGGQRFVFTGLSTKDIEDLKQLQRIMSKKSSTGSVSSRSSSSSSAYASYKAPLSRTTTLPPEKTTSTTTAGRPRSPPVNRTALSKAKERSRVRPRSKSPPPPPVTGGRKEGEGAEQRLRNLREEYLGDRAALTKTGKPDSLRSSSLSFHNPEPIYSVPRTKQRSSATGSPPVTSSADQSTQISLDVRHYETMVANLEKRLLDREQLLREAAQKMEALRGEQNSVVVEKNKALEQLERARRDGQNLLSSLEMSRTLNDKYEKRMQFVVEEMKRGQAEYHQLEEEKSTAEAALQSRITALEAEVSSLHAAHRETSSQSEQLAKTSHEETASLRRKLMETESLLMAALQRDLPDDELGVGGGGAGDILQGGSDVREVGVKLMRALKEIKALRKENVALNDQISEMNVEFADVREKLETITTQRDSVHCTDSAVSTDDLDDAALHRECHATIDALHTEISSLQSRLQSQEKRHHTDLSRRDDVLTSISTELAALAPSPDRHPPEVGEYKQELAEMQRIYGKSLLVMEREKEAQLAAMRCQFEDEVRMVKRMKEQELQDEVNATKAALEAVRKSYQDNLDAERNRLIEFYAKTPGGKNSEEVGAAASSQELAAEMEKLQQQLEDVAGLREECERLRNSQGQLQTALQRCQEWLHSLHPSAP